MRVNHHHSLFILIVVVLYCCQSMHASSGYSFGENFAGQLGNAAYGSITVAPYSTWSTPGLGGVMVKQTATGYGHSASLGTNGDLFLYGLNNEGQCGTANVITQAPIKILTQVEKVQTGLFHTVTKKTNGTIFVMGSNERGQLCLPGVAKVTEPTAISNLIEGSAVVDIFAGGWATMLKTENGNVYACGDNTKGALGVGIATDYITSLSRVLISDPISTVAVGMSHSLFVDTSFNLYATGSNQKGQLGVEVANSTTPVVVPRAKFGGSNITAIATGTYHSVVLDGSNRVWTFGSNDYEQLGVALSSTTHTSTPVLISSLGMNTTQIAASRGNTFALTSDGSLYSIGDNRYNLRDKVEYPLQDPEPFKVFLFEIPVLSIAVQYRHALLRTGVVPYGLGSNLFSQFGNTVLSDYHYEGVKVASDFNNETIISISSGGKHTLLLAETGHVYGIGSNERGQFGGINYEDEIPILFSTRPVQVNTNLDQHGKIVAVSAGYQHSAVLLDSGKVYCSGNGDKGQLGTGTKASSLVFVEVAGDLQSLSVNVTKISAGFSFTLALDEFGYVYAWGDNTYGQLGMNTSGIPVLEPVKISALQDMVVTDIIASEDYSVIINSDGEAYAFGRNDKYQLGDGTSKTTSSPTLVKNAVVSGTVSGLIHVSSGREHSLALKDNGHVYGWGQNTYSQLSPVLSGAKGLRSITAEYPVLNNIVSVAVGRTFSLALKNTGELYFWGKNGTSIVEVPTLMEGVYSRVPIKLLTAGVDFVTTIAKPGECREGYSGEDCEQTIIGTSPTGSQFEESVLATVSDVLESSTWENSVSTGVFSSPAHSSTEAIESSQLFTTSALSQPTSSDFPAESSLNSETTPTQESSVESTIVAESSESIPIPDLLLSVEIQNSQQFDACYRAAYVAQYYANYAVDTVDFAWTVWSSEDSIQTSQWRNSTIDIPVASLGFKMYTIKVNVTVTYGTIQQWAVASSSFTKPQSRFGKNCKYQIDYLSSFKSASEQIVLINRMNKLWIKLLLNDQSDLIFAWSTSMSTRSIADNQEEKYVITASDANAYALGAANGLPGDTDFTFRLQISSKDEKLFTKQFYIRTSPSKPITVPSVGLTFTTDMRTQSKYDGFALTTHYSFQADGWVPRLGESFTYVFSYYDNNVGRYIQLATNSNGMCVTTLPQGVAPLYELLVKLTVVNNWGDTAEKSITLRVGPQSFDEQIVKEYLSDLEGKDDDSFMSSSITLITYLEQNRQRSTTLLDQIMNRMSTLINGYIESSVNQTTIQQGLAVVDVLTKSRSASSYSQQQSLTLIDKILTAFDKNQTSTLTAESIQQVANVISNIVEKGFRNATISSNTLNTTRRLANSVLSQKLLTETATLVSTEKFQLVVKYDLPGNLVDSVIETGTNSSVYIPLSFNVSTSDMSYVALVFVENPYQSEEERSKPTATPVIDLTFLASDGSVIPVTNLTEPLIIQFSKPSRCDLMGEATFDCKYWDETEKIWKTDGCSWVGNETSDSAVSCSCTHTTSFSAFVLTKGKCPERAPGIQGTGIAFSTIYISICVAIIIGLVASRNTQPVKSRFISPYIGILAIILDSVLQGWIRNSLMLAGKQTDALSYIIMLTSNPLSVAALFVFAWQQLRFILLQNIYRMMDNKREYLNKLIIRTCRIIASKLIFSIVTVVVGVFVMIYFAVLVGVAAGVKKYEQTKIIIVVQSISYSVMLIAISIAIAALMLIDLIYSLRRQSAVSVEDGGMKMEKAKGFSLLVAHFRKDPLLFRVEASLILVTVMILITLFSVGIASVIQESTPKSPLKIATTVLEIIFIFAEIVAFGGFVCICGVKNLIVCNKSPYRKISDAENVDAQKNDFIVSILKHEHGFKLFYEYCRQEFSLENILLWQTLEDIRPNNLILNPQERKMVLEELYFTYIASNAERQVNMDSAVRKTAEHVVMQNTVDVASAEELYAKLNGVIMMNLSDTFTRLSRSQEFRIFAQAKHLSSELELDSFSQ